MVSKTPGGQASSDKFQKQQAQKEGQGADNAPGHTEGKGIDKNPGNAAVASDSGSTNVGGRAGTNQPGEKGVTGVPVDSQPSQGGANMST
ncbi:hypothetical protein LTR22_016393 [Elasticomyces elasticus]|nr:hypothetical protein LTR22_016393 [Elasticomyces elasticus]